MSVWVVDDGHIDVLVAAAVQWKLVSPDSRESLTKVGQSLLDENYASVNYRYDENEPTPRYKPTAPGGRLHPVAVLSALRCYEYQTDVSPTWAGSEAATFCQMLTSLILGEFPDLAVESLDPQTGEMLPAFYTHPVWDAAPWGFNDVNKAMESAYTESEK